MSLVLFYSSFFSSGGVNTASERCGPAGRLPAHAPRRGRAGLFPGGAWGWRPTAYPATAYIDSLYRVPFLVLECPNLKLKKPPWVHMLSAVLVYALVVVSFFLFTGGIIYDVTIEPPRVGSVTDEHGRQRPVAFLA